jgi:EAL domain-containing protein (putative c-di-GMP-specific phosphodiesterase class I)
VEALIRWHHLERGVVSPIEFIPIAEECGLINAIGAWVLAEAAKQISLWKDTELCDLRVSVNIASSQFQQPDFTDIVLNTLAQCGADPGNLELEVTESVVMNDVSTVVMRLKELREAGVRIAIDDFGTGYSSLSYLQDLPLDVLKIDRSFVSRLDCEQSKSSLVNTIMLLASGLGLETVAEGVENPEQLDSVMNLGCDYIQGYHYSKPVCANSLISTVRRINSVADEDDCRAA